MDPLSLVGNAIYYSFDAAGRVTKDFDAATQVVKIVNIGIQYLNKDLKGAERILLPLFTTLKVITDCQAMRNWVGNILFITSGEAAGGTDNGRKIYVTPDYAVPNFVRISSISCFLASNILNSLKWLDNLEIINLAKIAEGVGNLPVLGQVIGATLTGLVNNFIVFVVIGMVLDLLDTQRDIYQNGLTWYNGIQVVSDLAKLTGIALMTATGQLYVIGLVANATACVCILSRILMKSYKVGGAPVGGGGGGQ